MKKIFSMLLLSISSICFGQSEVNFYCNSKTYGLIVEKQNDDKYRVKIVGSNSLKIKVDTNFKKMWDSYSLRKRDTVAIEQLSNGKQKFFPKTSLLSSPRIIDTLKLVIEYRDTIVISDVGNLVDSELANGLSSLFSDNFMGISCKPDFQNILEKANLKLNENKKSSLPEVLENSFGFGFGIGPNFQLDKIYDYYVSPFDTTLKREKLNSPSFVTSLVITWNRLKLYRKYRDGDTLKATGELFRAPSWWGIALSFNFAEINPSSQQFNFRLSGGIGGLINLGSGFQVGFFYDLTQNKVLRSELESQLDKKYTLGDIYSLDQRLFSTQFTSSFSIKAIYKFKASFSERPGVLSNQ